MVKVESPGRVRPIIAAMVDISEAIRRASICELSCNSSRSVHWEDA